MEPQKTQIAPYDDEIVKKFVLVTLMWAFVAMLVGVIAALQLASLTWAGILRRRRPEESTAALCARPGSRRNSREA